MHRCEDERRFTGAALRDLDEIIPPGADIQPELPEAPEQRRRVCDIAVILARRRTNIRIIQTKRAFEIAALGMKQREMPGDVSAEIVAARPSVTRAFEPEDALCRAALHFMHMGDGMQ